MKSNHVLYRVTPIFNGDNKISKWHNKWKLGLLKIMVKGIHFNVYCYNVQPGIVIDYTTGEKVMPRNKFLQILEKMPKSIVNLCKII